MLVKPNAIIPRLCTPSQNQMKTTIKNRLQQMTGLLSVEQICIHCSFLNKYSTIGQANFCCHSYTNLPSDIQFPFSVINCRYFSWRVYLLSLFSACGLANLSFRPPVASIPAFCRLREESVRTFQQ